MASIRAVLIGAAVIGALAAPAAAKTAAASAALPSDTLARCSWERPGHDPFMGDVVAAVDRYQDIPADVRARLQARMAKREYDDIVSIRRDSITGHAKYGSTIRDMHFGTRQVCRSVTRASWAPDMQERGLVYCEGRECILVPTVCRNVSRIARSAVAPEHAEAPDEAAGPIGAVPADATDPLPDTRSGPLALDYAPSFAAPQDLPFGGGPGVSGPGDTGPYPWWPMASTATVPSVGGDTQSTTPPSSGGPGAPGTPPPLGGGGSSSGGGVPASVPEPQSWALMLFGLAVLAALRRRHAQARRSSGAR